MAEESKEQFVKRAAFTEPVVLRRFAPDRALAAQIVERITRELNEKREARREIREPPVMESSHPAPAADAETI